MEGDVRMLYAVVRRATSGLDGGGGAIYGEVTASSFQRILDVLVDCCALCEHSTFFDVGCGIGKPCLHAALRTGCRGLGVELVGGRWWQAMCVLHRALSHERLADAARRVFLAHADVGDALDLGPATHVYAFDKGFPPTTMVALIDAFGRSQARWLVSYQKPAAVAAFGLDVRRVARVPTSMSGSGERQLAFVYERRRASDLRVCPRWTVPLPPLDTSLRPHDPSYALGLSAMESGVAAYGEWLTTQIGLRDALRRLRPRK